MLLELVKKALRTKTNASDEELQNLIEAALIDLSFGGADNSVLAEGQNALVNQAVILYCKAHFGLIDPNDYDRVKKAYDEIKAQIGMATGFTVWPTEA